MGLNSGGSTCSHYRGWNTQQPRYPREEHFKKLKEWLEFGDLWDEKIAEVEREVVGKTNTNLTVYQNIGGTNVSGEVKITKGTSAFEGWGTALKPALEPITVARKPLSEKSVAENCLKWGVGGINIDGCRVGFDMNSKEDLHAIDQWERQAKSGVKVFNQEGDAKLQKFSQKAPIGRFPANLIHDGSEEVRECFPETNTHGGGKGSDNKADWGLKSKVIGEYKNDSGNASRFFKSIVYVPKASKAERNIGCEGLEKGCTHPTVKPVALMEYLVKLVSKEGHIVLDPFMGSGTTGMACKKLDRDFIGIEMMPEYMEIAKCRIEGVKKREQLNML